MKNFREQIIDNMNANGGGLAVNLTGKYESNRHALARSEKFTFGEWTKFLKTKKGGKLHIDSKLLLHVYRVVNGEPEWHHAGFLPKSYGGGMKKTYFVEELQDSAQVIKMLKKYSRIKTRETIRNFEKYVREERQQEFLKINGEVFLRESKLPQYAVRIEWEMNGKYGWFPADSRYTLQEFASGWRLFSEDKFNEYNAI